MERRKHRGSNLDELAIVKAAAWTWYQHGSGAEGRLPMREYDLSRTQKPPKPSRYKLEAIRDYYAQEQEDPKLQQLSSPIVSPSSSRASDNSRDISLLDTYEIERISRQLNAYIESSRVKHMKSFLGGETGNSGYRKVVSLFESGTSEKRSKPRHKTLKGFWPVLCGGSGHDVVVEVLEGGGRIGFEGSSRRQVKNFPVI